MRKIILSFLLAILISLSSPLIWGSQAKQRGQQKKIRNSVQKLGKQGVILFYNKKLTARQRRILKKFSKKHKLFPKNEGKSLKFIYFQSKKKRVLSNNRAQRVCADAKNMSFIKDCIKNSQAKFDISSETTQAQEARTGGAIVTSPAAVDPRDPCGLFPNKTEIRTMNRPDYWAMEAIGADLVQQERHMPGVPFHNVRSYICDKSKNNHDYSVQYLVDGPSPKNPSKIINCEDSERTVHFLNEVIKTHHEQTILINRSMGFDYEGDWLQNSSILKSIAFVNSAGNTGFESSELNTLRKKYCESRDIFCVGSLAPIGLPSKFSSEGSGVLLSAPSDYSITTCPTNQPKCSLFGGTSGAAPQVSYTFKAALEALPYLTKKHLEKLSLETRIMLPSNFENPLKNGHGMVNAYKTWRVVLKLAKNCQRAVNKRDCIDKEISKKDVFQFDLPMKGSELSSRFPQCFGKPPGNFSCTEQKENFLKLRQSAFLRPKDKKYWKVTSCVHKQAGHLETEKFYNNVGRDFNTVPFSGFEIENYGEHEKIRWGRYATKKTQEDIFNRTHKKAKNCAGLWRFGNKVYSHLVRSSRQGKANSFQALCAIQNAKEMNNSGLNILIAAYDNGQMTHKKSALREIHKRGNLAIPLLNKALDEQDEDLLNIALRETAKLGDKGVPLLIKALSLKKPEMLKSVVRQAFRLGDSGVPVLSQALKNSNPTLVLAVLDEASYKASEGNKSARKYSKKTEKR